MNLPPNALCSKAPDLNGVENVWNKVETDLKELGKREGWPKNREELIQRLKQIIDGIHLVNPAVSFTRLVPVISKTMAKAKNMYA